MEKNAIKPFNPLLGETFDYENEEFKFFSEQVSHHPPVAASIWIGKKQNFRFWTNSKMNSKFNGRFLEINQVYHTYCKLEDHNETYEFTAPTISAHNLVVGTLYLDMGGAGRIRILEKPEYEAKIKYFRRGWLSKDEFKLNGDVTRVNP